jgi:hypothetical protein
MNKESQKQNPTVRAFLLSILEHLDSDPVLEFPGLHCGGSNVGDVDALRGAAVFWCYQLEQFICCVASLGYDDPAYYVPSCCPLTPHLQPLSSSVWVIRRLGHQTAELPASCLTQLSSPSYTDDPDVT